MKEFYPLFFILLGSLLGVLGVLQLDGTYSGMVKRSPPSAPITTFSTCIVFLFGVVGITLCVVGGYLNSARAGAGRKWRMCWPVFAIAGISLNAMVIGVWGFWIGDGMLLPYEEWVRKVGMG